VARGKRVSFTLRDRDARLIRKLARHHRVSEADMLRLAVWAYIVPLVPSLKAPVDLPEPIRMPTADFARPRRRRVDLGRTAGRG
jgi:hypothetical protein